MSDSGGDITRLLRQWQGGDEASLEAALPAVWHELRRIAAHELRANRGHDTLQPTALVNDLFVRLLGAGKLDITNRKHLYTTAAKVMRQVLIDRARAHVARHDWDGPAAAFVDAMRRAFPARDAAAEALRALVKSH